VLIDEKISIKNKGSLSTLKNQKFYKKIDEIENLNLKKKLNNLIEEFGKKNSK